MRAALNGLALLGAPTAGRLLDLLAGGVSLILGASVALVAASLVAAATSIALRAQPSNGLVVIGRGLVGALGAVLLGLGLVFVGAAIEAAAGRPFGDATGALSLVAWWLALRTMTYDAALGAALAQRLARRTDETHHVALAYFALAGAIGAWALAWTARACVLFVGLWIVVG